MVVIAALALMVNGPSARAVDFNPDGIDGTLVICGGGELPERVDSVFRDFFADSNDSDEPSGETLVIIPFAGSDHDQSFSTAQEHFVNAGISQDEIVRASDDMDALAEQIDDCRALWFCGGQQSRLAKALLNTAAEDAIYRLLKRDGLVGGTSAGAAIMSRTMIQSSNPVPVITTGLNLLPGGIVDQHFRQRKRLPRLQHAIKEHSDHFGIGIDEQTAVIVRGRSMQVTGKRCCNDRTARGSRSF